MSGRARWFVAMLLLLALALGSLWLGEFLITRGLDWATKFSGVGAFVLALVTVLLALASAVVRWLRPPRITPAEIEAAMHDLKPPSPRRHTEKKQPMPVRLDVTPAAEAVMSGASSDGARTLLETVDRTDIFAIFSRVPSRRLVVLGTVGAGKSVQVTYLARRLLSNRGQGDPVPIIVRAATWNPNTKLADWIADELIRDNSDLRVPRRVNGRTVTLAHALVTSGGVLPLIDGLDEMPRPSRAEALIKINEYGLSNPLVVTSRTDEYQDAVGAERARAVGRATVFELCPLRAPDIKHYLRETTVALQIGNWARVFERLDAEPDGQLTDTLANPLMLWVASMVYKYADPDELADRALFASRARIERHLLTRFIPTAYADHSEQGSQKKFRCTSQQAQRWLGFLAGDYFISDSDVRYTRRNQNRAPPARDLSWWRLPDAAGKWRLVGIGLRVALLSSLMWALVVWVLSQHGNWSDGAYVGPIHFRDMLLGGPLGRLIRPTVDQLLSFTPSVGLDISQVVATLIQKIKNSSSLTLYVVLLVLATWVGGVQLLSDRRPKRLKIRPTKTVRAALNGIFWCACLTVMTGISILGSKSSPPHTVQAFLRDVVDSRSTWISLLAVSLLGVIWVPSSFTTLTDVSGTTSPAEVLRLDKRADRVVTLSKRSIFAVAVGLYSGPQIALTYTVFAVTATLVGIVLGGQRAFVSRSYTDACLWLACSGRLPWRTMSFLVDAEHDREVLRQVGAAYQFRHIRLEQQLREWWRHRWLERSDRRDELHELIRERLEPRLRELRSRRMRGSAEELEEPVFEQREDKLREKVDADRAGVETDPITFLPRLAESLSNLAFKLHRLGRREKELAVRREIVETYRALAATNSTMFLPDLAESWGALACDLALMGWRQEELAAISDGVDVYRKLALTRPATFSQKLAQSLNSLASGLREHRSQEEELAETSQVVTIYHKLVDVYHELARSNPATFRPKVAESLSDLASTLRRLGRWQDELAAVNEAAGIYRKLGEEQLSAVEIHPQASGDEPAGFLLDRDELRWRLDHLGIRLWKLGQRAEAVVVGEISQMLAASNAWGVQNLTAAQEEVRSARKRDRWPRRQVMKARFYNEVGKRVPVGFIAKLSEANLAHFLPYRAEVLKDLAEVLDTQAFRLQIVGQDKDALDTRNETVDIYREVVNIYRELTKRDPLRFQPDFTEARATLAFQRRMVGQEDATLAATTEALELRRRQGPA